MIKTETISKTMEHLPVQQAPYKNVFLYFDPEDVDDSDDNDSSIDEDIVAEKFHLFQEQRPSGDEKKTSSINYTKEETSKKDEIPVFKLTKATVEENEVITDELRTELFNKLNIVSKVEDQGREGAQLLQEFKDSGKLYMRPDKWLMENENEDQDVQGNTLHDNFKNKNYVSKSEAYVVVNSLATHPKESIINPSVTASPFVQILYSDDVSFDKSPDHAYASSPATPTRTYYQALHQTLQQTQTEKQKLADDARKRIVQRLKSTLETKRVTAQSSFADTPSFHSHTPWIQIRKRNVLRQYVKWWRSKKRSSKEVTNTKVTHLVVSTEVMSESPKQREKRLIKLMDEMFSDGYYQRRRRETQTHSDHMKKLHQSQDAQKRYMIS